MAAAGVRVLDGPPVVPDTPEALLRECGGPVFFRVPGRDRSRTRAVATLLHGDEPSGVRAVHAWLRSGCVPAVDVVVFFGAVEAALEGAGFRHRALPGARDLNRCFAPPCEGSEATRAAQALDLLRETRPEALVDLHNTSGRTPPYGLGPDASPALLGLAGLFARNYVCTGALGLGALVEATGGSFPSVVVECGQRGDPEADRVAREGLERFTGVAQLGGEEALTLFRDPVRVELAPGVTVAFGEGATAHVDLVLRADADRFNLRTLPPGTPLGWVRPGSAWPLRAAPAGGRDRSRSLFRVADGRLCTRGFFTPVMMTTDPAAARGDCVCYAARPAAGGSRPRDGAADRSVASGREGVPE